MSLNWDLRACDESVRTDEAWPFTESLIFATMAIDMGEITDDNIVTFAERLAAYAMVRGSICKRMDGGAVVDVPVTVDMLRPYVGLRTNVTTVSDTKFRALMGKRLMERAAEQVAS